VTSGIPTLGSWHAASWVPAFTAEDLAPAAGFVREPVHVVREPGSGRLGVARGGTVDPAPAATNGRPAFPWVGSLPALWPEWLGDRSFTEVHGLRFPYVAGAMANGIHTSKLTIAMARAGMLGFFGAAGLSIPRITQALDEITGALGPNGPTWGMNLIHSPNEPEHEMATVELYLARGVRRVEAASYMGLNPMVVRFAYHGLRTGPDGKIIRPNGVFAKISRPEIARRFLSPAPAELLEQCVAKGWLTREEADLGRKLAVAEDIIVESDSGGHTDNRPLSALFPTILQVRDEVAAEFGYERPIRVGAAGGLGTPSAVAAAFGLGAAFVLTGSVNQASVESGLSPEGKRLLAQADLADVIMAPAADMFEMGVKVQVLKRGTMFGSRAIKLYDAYLSHPSWEAIPAPERARIEKECLQSTFDEVWKGCEQFFLARGPHELDRAAKDPKHKMALVFRWYLGLSSKWAIAGEGGRKLDYQIWCGPAMGAFNAWVKGTFLEPLESRSAVQIAANLLEGAVRITRAHQLRSYGVPIPPAAFRYTPQRLIA
jgi:PfaD family protein